ncbi:hypothetical protein [Shimia abyssi]|uniref:EF hand domain-containing protein n=1 Tax=Shimia abyssi TaxID=1662395 RepID=A0A2P8FG57_9RHOB|nr:hypothetical protein [Shimia abyssi]PSL20688.1 EF hand domain-containing protein [Shimia abyssi]
MTMIKPVLGTALTLIIAASVHAQSNADANGDGLLTIEEVVAVYPDLTNDVFSAMDTNGDGVLDADEVGAAQDAGLMPPADG